MNMKITNSIIILILICFLKLIKTETEELNTNPVAEENHNDLFNQIKTIKEILGQLDTDVDKLHKGIGQQADIVYADWRNDAKAEASLNPEIPLNQSEIMENCFNNFNTKLFNLNENTEITLQTHDNLLWNKTEAIFRTIATMNKCLATDSHTKITNILEKLNKYIARCDILKKKVVNFNKQEDVLEQSSKNLSKIMTEISSKLDSQNQYFESLEKQLPVLQAASNTLDDYIIRKNEYHSYQQRCQDTGNCHHRHHSRHSH
ncbi:uncharacterized protein LOC135955083 [Calliphora vicina]|uniref:uncharacterized protein LOC135955083 n=1 Tax=Calliphora vicina TaxID=7373 RepID=UPI00325BEBD1